MKIFLAIILLSTILFAGNYNKEDNFFKYDTYFKYYGNKYGVSYLLLKAIALTENRFLNPNAIYKNTNGTKDLGLMQINTLWIKELPQFHLSEKKLKNVKTNIEVAAYILSNLIKKNGYSWDTIGMYHSRTEKHKHKWVKITKENIKFIAKRDKHVKIRKY